ncbi:MAG: GNAT family N-acetyltransferase [Chloroflexota bacterium]
MEISIRMMAPGQISSARELILSVAGRIYDLNDTEGFSQRHTLELVDVDNFQQEYWPPDGIFLVAMDNDTLIGTGAIRRLNENTAELKRMWLLEAYHSQGIGYRLAQALFSFARAADYRHICLMTGVAQIRAINFYQRLGFYSIEPYQTTESDDVVWLGYSLDDQNLPEPSRSL